MKIITGWQTGVDRAALDAALKLSTSCGGWCPKGRIAEDGAISSIYPLQETLTENYSERTQWNVRDSDGTLIIVWASPLDGTQVTVDFAKKTKKPFYIVDMEKLKSDEIESISDWIKANAIENLNIVQNFTQAGPPDFKSPDPPDFMKAGPLNFI